MINETKHFYTDYLRLEDNKVYFDLADGVDLFVKYTDKDIKIAKICWNSLTKECDLKFKGASLQDFITSWDLYKEFVQLLDESYDTIQQLNLTKI